MPNHVTNRIYIPDKEKFATAVAGMRTEHKEGKILEFDFNKLIPMPRALSIECSSAGDKGLKAYKEVVEASGAEKDAARERFYALPEWEQKLGFQYYMNLRRYGVTTWYDWCCQEWGTKWNAYDESIGTNTIWFNTAWSAPLPVIDAFAEKFELTMLYCYADEDMGRNCGYRIYEDGKPDGAFDYLWYDAKSFKFAMTVQDMDEDSFTDWGLDFDLSNACFHDDVPIYNEELFKGAGVW